MTINTFEQMLTAFGAGSNRLSAAERAQLDDAGYLVLPPDPVFWSSRGVDLDEVRVTLDRLTAEEGWRGGSEGREDRITPTRPIDPGSDRLKNLIDKAPVFRHFICHPKILAAVHHIIGGPFKSSGVEMRSPRRGGGEQQLHIDWLPRMDKSAPYPMVVVGIYIDGMTAANGALRVISGTHKNLDWPNEYIDVLTRHPDEIQVEVEPGSMIVLNSHVWHGGARNESGEPRRTLYLDYRSRDIGQALNQKHFLRPETISSLTEAERFLLAVRPEDPTDETLTLGMGASYRARYGDHYLPTPIAAPDNATNQGAS